MRNMDWLRKTPVLRLNEIARRLSSKGYARLAVHRMVKQGAVARVTKGAYSASDDIFAVATNLHYPSYASFLAASYRQGLTEAIPRLITVATTKRHPPIDFKRYRIEFARLSHIWGYHKEGDGANVAFIADIEKLMLDAFLRPGLMGNFEEIRNVFKNGESIDAEKIRAYLKRLGSNKIYRQVGYMLGEYNGMDIHGLIPVDNNYYDLNPFAKKTGKTADKKWRLWV
ncbi:TPA: hypothetical protein HA316_03040 [Candidatus Micrarchaeota archaeon]|nr:hypothetical protein [Candidatus Micrarchaeota archaeon]